MTLDQILMEIEPIFRGSNGAFQFTRPSFQEILTAKQFADEINSGALSVRDAYVNFWSYEEDADLWGLPKDREWRALLPAWEKVLLHMAPLLNITSAQKLVDVVSRSYFNSGDIFGGKDYNPFFDELCFVSKLVKASGRKIEVEDVVMILK